MGRADVEIAQALAHVATIAIHQHRAVREGQLVNEQLENAPNSRIAIEQAKGMVAEPEGLDMEQAFSMLRDHARNHNLRLADLANDVVRGTVAASALDRPPPGEAILTTAQALRPRPRVGGVAGAPESQLSKVSNYSHLSIQR